jgi:succinoglycan biosynthesis transport protein ExoP
LIDARSNLPIPATEHSQYSMPLPLAGEQETGGGFTLLQLWHILRAYLWLSVGIFVVMVGLAFAVIKLMPKSYEATAALIVNSDNTDPLAGRNQPQGLTYTFFPTQVELINNSVVLGPVIDRLKLQADRQFTGGFVGDPKALMDVVLGNLRTVLRVQQGTNSQFLYISATASDPAQAAEITNAVTDEYLNLISNRTNAPALERASRYSAQLAELKEKFDLAQEKVAEFREKHGMANLNDGQGGGDQEGAALLDLQDKLLKAQNERRLLESQPDDGRAESTAVLGAPEAVTMRGALDTLESQLEQSRTTLGPRHPRVLQLQTEIDATRAQLQSTMRARLASVRDLEAKYQAAVTMERNRLLDRRALQDEGAKLLLEQQAAKETYSQALRGMDQVQFASVGNYKDVAVLSRAEPPVKPTKPKKLKLFLMAVAASFALALGGPFAYELLFSRRIRCRDDLERHFRIVMLAHFERMNSVPAA